MSKYSLREHYKEDNLIAIVPIKSFHIEKKILVGNVIIFPENPLSAKEIRGATFDFSFEEIKDEFCHSTLITFIVDDMHMNHFGTFFQVKSTIYLRVSLVMLRI